MLATDEEEDVPIIADDAGPVPSEQRSTPEEQIDAATTMKRRSSVKEVATRPTERDTGLTVAQLAVLLAGHPQTLKLTDVQIEQ